MLSGPVVGLMLVLAALVATAGCGSASNLPLGTVKGKVLYQGQTLDHGRVVFIPMEGTPGPQGVGQIESDGSFRIETGKHDGAAVGKHMVTVHCRREPTPEQARDMLFVPESLIPEKYSKEHESPLRFEVKQGANEYPIELAD